MDVHRKSLPSYKTWKALRIISEALGLSVANNNVKRLPRGYMLYAISIGLLLIGTFIYEMCMRIRLVYVKLPSTVKALNAMGLFLLTITSLYSLTSAIFFRRKYMTRLTKELNLISDELQTHYNGFKEYECKIFARVVIIVQVLVVIFIVHDITILHLTIGLRNYFSNHLMTHVTVYYLSILSLHIIGYSLDIYSNYFRLNGVMHDIVSEILSKSGKRGLHEQSLEHMKFFIRIFDKLCDCVVLLNKCFGPQIVLFVTTSIVHTIHALNVCTKSSLWTKSQNMTTDYWFKWSPEIALSMLLLVSYKLNRVLTA